jgi:hypothetical protein
MTGGAVKNNNCEDYLLGSITLIFLFKNSVNVKPRYRWRSHIDFNNTEANIEFKHEHFDTRTNNYKEHECKNLLF